MPILYPTISYLLLIFPTISYLLLIYHTIPYLLLIYHTIPYLLLIYHSKSYLLLLYPTMSYLLLTYRTLLNTVQWLFDFKQFDWFGGHRLSAHILMIDCIWKTHGCEAVMGHLIQRKQKLFLSRRLLQKQFILK